MQYESSTEIVPADSDSRLTNVNLIHVMVFTFQLAECPRKLYRSKPSHHKG